MPLTQSEIFYALILLLEVAIILYNIVLALILYCQDKKESSKPADQSKDLEPE